VEVLTFGHGTASSEAIVDLLRTAGVELVVDIRTAPGSRRNPHVSRAEMERWLPEHGIAYRWERRLGGWRKAAADSPDLALRNRSFAGYAAHMRSEDFAAAVDALLVDAAERRTAVMCAESMWWHCHRMMLADYLTLVRHVDVQHLLPDGRLQAHSSSDVARRRDDGLLIYDAGQQTL
jgi:uncharacterized protein (DUF488 family)